MYEDNAGKKSVRNDKCRYTKQLKVEEAGLAARDLR